MENKAVPDLNLSDLNSLYSAGYECDKRIFSEMRTNLQLVSGEHYAREGSRFWTRIRDDKQLTAEQRLKLTKNHIQRVTKIYRNEIEAQAPDVSIDAANEKELSDQKAAELNYSYWQYIKRCDSIDAKRAMWIKNFVEIGEVCVKIFWDMNGGQQVGFEPQMQENPESKGMEMLLDETGNPIASDIPVYGGRIRVDTFEAYNLRRDPNVRTMDESPYLAISKLISKKALSGMIKDPDKQQALKDAPTDEWSVFDNNTGSYRTLPDQILVKEIYYRPAPQIPKGYYFIFTGTVEIARGELPYGIFPIIHAGFDEQTGNPRSHSIIRHIRAPQIEINRCASKIAETQVTLGDDKVYIPANAKLSQGSMLPGIRINTFTGPQPMVTPGRSGDQYFSYLEGQINELYVLANLSEIIADVQESSDPYTNLFKSFRFKKKFAIYGMKFERFMKQVVETCLAIARQSANENELVPAFGKSEYINIAEFKGADDLHYKINIQPRTDDIETQFGKQLAINHALQYVGQALDKEDIGQMLRNSPFLNKEKMFQKFTQKYDNAVNTVLALDRGIPRPVRPYGDHQYMIDALATRMDGADFEFLDPKIQQLYQQTITEYEQAKTKQLQDIERAQSGFIPSGGYMVACDFYEPAPTPGDPEKVKRVRVPSESLSWLLEKLQTQGTALQQLELAPKGALQDISNMLAPPGMNTQPISPAFGGMNG